VRGRERLLALGEETGDYGCIRGSTNLLCDSWLPERNESMCARAANATSCRAKDCHSVLSDKLRKIRQQLSWSSRRGWQDNAFVQAAEKYLLDFHILTAFNTAMLLSAYFEKIQKKAKAFKEKLKKKQKAEKEAKAKRKEEKKMEQQVEAIKQQVKAMLDEKAEEQEATMRQVFDLTAELITTLRLHGKGS